MPIQLTEKDDGKVLVIDVSDKLAKKDFADFVPAFEQCARKHKKLRVLFDMTHFHGWKARGFWEEIKFDAKHLQDIGRLAVVGDQKWHQAMTACCKPFVGATTRYFDQTEVTEAGRWLREG